MSQRDENAVMLAVYPSDSLERNPDGQVVDPAYEAHRMRLLGYTWKVIAKTVGYSSAENAFKAVSDYYQAAARQRSNRREEALQEAISRVEMLLQPYFEAAMAGDIGSANLALKCIQEINKLNGLYLEITNHNAQTVVIINGQEGEYVEKLKQIALAAEEAKNDPKVLEQTVLED